MIATAGALALCCGQAAIAQTQSPAAPVADEIDGGDIDEVSDGDIVVTGSRLKSSAPVGSTLVYVGRDDMEISNAITASDLFRNLPLVNNLGVSESLRSGNGGSANYTFSQGLNIHGVGPYATLMLIDGQRIAPQGAYGLIVSDTSLVPTIALERLEIVPDGASAVYGSDAIAGVANLILRRRFKGLEASASYGVADDYTQYQASIIGGTNWGTGYATLAYSYSGHSELKAIDRSFARTDLTPRGGNDFRPTQCNPGNIIVGGTSYAIPAGGVTPANAGALIANTSNRCDNALESYLLPLVERHNVVATLDQDLSANLAVFATGLYSHRRIRTQGAWQVSTLAVPATNAFFVRPAGTTGPETIRYAFTELRDSLVGTGSAEYFQGTVGARLDLSADWRASLSFTYGKSKDRLYQTGRVNNSALAAALASSNPATAFNPYGGPNSPAVLATIGNGQSSYFGRGEQYDIDVGVTGKLLDLPGGAVDIAIGYQRQHNRQYAYNLAGSTVTPITNVQLDSRRHVDSAYTEIRIPLVGSENSFPGVRSLTLNLAGRYDRYSDVGSTTNPKVGVDWEAVQGLRLHGSFSKSFRAPPLYHAHGNGNSFVATLSDPLLGGAATTALELIGGNAAKPETATTFSLGLDVRPTLIPGLSGKLSYFNVRYKNVIAALGNNAQLLNQAYYADLGIVTRNPSPALVASTLAAFPLVSGNVPANLPVIIDTRARNLGTLKVSGLDFVVDYDHDIANAGTVEIGGSGTYYLKYDSAAAPGAPYVDLLGTILNPTKYQLRGYLGWRKSGFDVRTVVNHSDGYRNNLVVPSETVSSNTTVDLHIGFSLPEPAPASKLRFALDVTNLFDRDPPFTNIGPSTLTEGGWDAAQASPIGRIIALSVTAGF